MIARVNKFLGQALRTEEELDTGELAPSTFHTNRLDAPKGEGV